LFLLYPMPGPFEQATAQHVRAGVIDVTGVTTQW
jgi:hypothetical protein